MAPDLNDLNLVDDPTKPAQEAIREAIERKRGSIRVRLLPQLYSAATRNYGAWTGLAYRFELPIELDRVMRLKEAFDAFFRAIQRHGFDRTITALEAIEGEGTDRPLEASAMLDEGEGER